MWAGIIHNQIIYAFFDGHMNGVKYLQILREKVENYLEHIPLNEVLDIIWQQDGAPCHNTLQVTNYLNQHFDEWIGRNGPIRWPPRSPDLTPLDFFLWGYLKTEVYKQRSNDVDELRERIIAVINDINNSNMLEDVGRNFLKRINLCLQNNGSHIEQLF